ncbi:Methyltransferase FkbM [Trichormus variabilis ATCC 29413]|uniref:Methyltransferase FkbM n=2 Tax=Anabaena variabilis TaxID=264691 RepID=Q3M6U6_TRIV2|nr:MULTISPECIES: FkbM family methyltransferase [Nostocaceae]ABA23290.1 Methyltransferase FkbM [Trichormus variabilis ATCC 29413]MBC1216378.1 FkbM family methyltransferase [Trichormus variabilis ARAD]MBC1258825.1 FkbM family methyltransferase [Trichormus variabilis V5]MBC1267490.1 FkbM family methyltransferase [Trichormus variabilis FSR]MBC1304101.1 FkbM family methyltransferase [Trichormus variabilis N2B]
MKQIKKFVKNVIQQIFRFMGFYLSPLHNTPFGVEWGQDINYLLDGKNLELVIDVGANIGQTVYEVLRYFPQSRIYCFEPVPSTFNRLNEEVGVFSNVYPYNMALGDKPSTLSMIAEPFAQKNTLVFDVEKTKNNNIEVVDVKVDTLDQFCLTNNIDKISLLKVDTEGYEMKVLKGAEQLLSSGCIDYILIECDFLKRADQPHGDFIEILKYLQSFQYNVVSFYTGGVDHLGWIWGDVLFRKISNDETVFAMSPFPRQQVSIG